MCIRDRLGSSLVINVLTNDTATDAALDVDSVETSTGAAAPQPDGTIVFTPPADTDISAHVTFTYTVQDVNGVMSNAATVTVTVTEAPNVAPLAMNDDPPESVAIGSSLTIDVLANDQDDANSLDVSSVVASITSAEPQSNGTIAVSYTHLTLPTICSV